MACDGRVLRQRGSDLLFLLLFLTSFVSLVLSGSDAVNGQPNIIFILADDLGWNDVGFHGSNQIPTPNIDSLAYSGIILNNYYVTPICTPSRSALMTGKHPIHTGMQHTVLYGAEPRGLPLSEKILPEYLKELGYSNHIVGKWHLGHYKREYTPLYRGFDSHIGFWTGHHDYYDHTAMEQQMWGLDMRRGLDVAWDLHGQYSTEIFARESVNVINNHNKSSPLFLYLAHTAVHSGNPYTPLRAPDNVIEKFGKIDDYQRRKFAAMVTEMDDSVGKVIQALEQNDMLSNSIIIFSSDNGGPAAGFNINAASNYPLRGVKNTLWEGGVRAAGLIWSPLIKKRNRVANQLFHVSDWLPTLYAAAGGKKELVFKDVADGKNQWKPLSEDLPSKRSVILHNIDDIWRSASLTSGNWKIHKGTNYNGDWDGWYGPAGREGSYQTKSLEECPAARALKKLNLFPTEEVINSMRNKATITCKKVTPSQCNPLIQLCLYNIERDPCEERNVAESEPAKLQELISLLAALNATAVPPGNMPLDPQGNPKFWNYTWTNFGDYLSEHVTLQMQ